VRTGPRRRADPKDKITWLLIKKRDEFASAEDVLEAHPRSVLSGPAIEELRAAPAAGRTIAAYLARQHLGEFSRPLRRATFPPMLARLADKPFDSEQWLFELKYAGVRVLAIRDAGAIHLFARGGTEITNHYPEVVFALKAHPFDLFVIDGEAVAVNDRGRPDFRLPPARIHINDKRQIARLSYAVPVRYFVFDILAFDRYDARTLPLVISLFRNGPIRYAEMAPPRIAGHPAESAGGREGASSDARSFVVQYQ